MSRRHSDPQHWGSPWERDRTKKPDMPHITDDELAAMKSEMEQRRLIRSPYLLHDDLTEEHRLYVMNISRQIMRVERVCMAMSSVMVLPLIHEQLRRQVNNARTRTWREMMSWQLGEWDKAILDNTLA